jgi:ABC-type branched-subunit amino acid transport system substrate-binding protein
MRRLKLAAAVALAATVLTACAGTSNKPATSSAATGGVPAAAPGFDPATKTITVGTLIPTSGVFATSSQDVIGVKAAFHRATQPGGPLEGYKIEVRQQDTQYKADIAIPQYNSAKNDVVLFAAVLGTPIVHALRPQLKADKVAVVPAAFDELFIRDPNIAPVFPPYAIYQAGAVQYAAEKEGKQDATFCSLMQDDALGDSFKKGYDWATAALKLRKGPDVRYPIGLSDFTAQVSQLKNAGCGVVSVGGAGLVMQNAAVRAVQLGYDALWLNSPTSYTNDISRGAAADYIIKNALYFVTGTDWTGAQAKGQSMMIEDVKAIDPGATAAANTYQTGYVDGLTAVAILAKAIANGDLSRDGILKVVQTGLGTVDTYGLQGGNYEYGQSVADRNPPRSVSVFNVSPDAPTGLKLKEFEFASSVAKSYAIPAQ